MSNMDDHVYGERELAGGWFQRTNCAFLLWQIHPAGVVGDAVCRAVKVCTCTEGMAHREINVVLFPPTLNSLSLGVLIALLLQSMGPFRTTTKRAATSRRSTPSSTGTT